MELCLSSRANTHQVHNLIWRYCGAFLHKPHNNFKMDNFKDLIIFSVSIIICCAVLAMIGVLGNVCGKISDTKKADILRNAALVEYETIGHLGGQKVTGAEVVSVIRENTVNQKYIILLETDNGNYVMNHENYSAQTWSLSNLQKEINLSRRYSANLLYAEDGSINGVEFFYE